MTISILILTLNEEQNLRACLESVRWSDDVVVLDSFSSDGTVEIAKAFGARVIQRKFDNWAAHQNWAMENIEFKHPWVFYLDADERMTEELRSEIAAIAANPSEPRVAFFCGRKNFFMGKWIRHAMPPGMIMRFFQPRRIRFERLVNPTPIVDGPHGYLTNYFLHYNFSKGLTEWFDKHNRYSQMEALEGIKLLKKEAGPQPSVFSRDPFLRRKALKNLSFRMPFRPLLKFIYLYVFKLGFMDGYAGWVYCRLQAMYEYMIVLKMKELQRQGTGLPK
jgi:glycosyltransferase involved in cell wall biosynthesis